MKQIKNIAFDLGGVVLALSLEGGIKGFEKIGVRDARQRLDAYQQKGVFADLESGRISKEEFRQEMCRLTGKEITLQDCFEAWHGYVDYVPQQNLETILRLREKGYQVCLLSNTNPFMTMWTDSPAFDSQGRPMSYFFVWRDEACPRDIPDDARRSARPARRDPFHRRQRDECQSGPVVGHPDPLPPQQ